MTKYKTHYIPEDYVFDTIEECLEKYPEQAVSHLWDMSEVLHAYQDLKLQAEQLAEALGSLDQPLCERIIDPMGYDPRKESKDSLVNSVLVLSDENEKSLNVVRQALARFETWKKGDMGD